VRLRDLDLRVNYGLGDNLLTEFYIPVLSCAVRYDRVTAYFNSQGLAGAAAGLARFIEGGGAIRLMVSPNNWDARDIQALRGCYQIPEGLAARLAAALVPENEVQADRLAVLAWLVREGRLEAKIVVGPVVELYHQKFGILYDADGDGVAFTGSANETISGWERNAENLRTDCTWRDASQRESFQFHARQFEGIWNNRFDFRAFPFPDAFTQQLLKLAPDSPPLHVDLPAAAATKPSVTFFPHQEKGVTYLVDAFPRSRLLADEVGLGKTITAGGALMRLLGDGQCERALILAPANVCIQWQEELAQKFGCDCPRLGARAVHWADGGRKALDSSNPFAAHDLLIASSHLVRRPSWRKQLETARQYDLIILDEAHHARRFAPGSDLKRNVKRSNQLLKLLDEVLVPRSRCLWLLTATPVQLHLVEFFDLLCALYPKAEAAASPLRSWSAFEAFYASLVEPTTKQDWDILGRGVGPLPVFDKKALPETLTPAERKRLTNFGRNGRDPNADAVRLCAAGHRNLLLQCIQARSPGGRYMLRRTRRQADIAGDFARRVPVKVEIEFATPAEKILYEELDEFILRLWRKRRERERPRGFGFMLATYRKRLTSSWRAVSLTITRALAKQDVPADEIELMELGLDPAEADESAAKAYASFSEAERRKLQDFADRVQQMVDREDDPKIRRLQSDIEACRAKGESVLLFTQFADTLHYLRTYLLGPYREQVACYTGSGGQIWRNDTWVPESKAGLTRSFAEGRIAILLCTDAASEGLNLQRASTLLNYDLPWNPMRVEQRIGRIDRINQQADTLDIRNYVLKGTIEDRVYEVLEARIKVFESTVGATQPILGRVEEVLTDSAPEEAATALEKLCDRYGAEGEAVAAALS